MTLVLWKNGQFHRMREVQLPNYTAETFVGSFHISEAINDFRELPTTRCPRLGNVNTHSVQRNTLHEVHRFALESVMA